MEVAIPEYLEGKNFDDYEYKLDSLLTGFDGKPTFVFHFAPANKKVKATVKDKFMWTRPAGQSCELNMSLRLKD